MNISGVNRIRVLVLAACIVVVILYMRFFMQDSYEEVSTKLRFIVLQSVNN